MLLFYVVNVVKKLELTEFFLNDLELDSNFFSMVHFPNFFMFLLGLVPRMSR